MREHWKKRIVYQIYPRSFYDSNGDGIGDLQGIISKLDYIYSLGVDTIWLSPVYQSPNDDNGYDISDYYQIQPEFGTLDDMEQLITKAKALGIGIIMDLVINHTSDEHEWFIKSMEKDPEYRDFYIWKDQPNNWSGFFSGTTWEKIDDQYYLHLFSKKQPDLNWKNPKVYDEIKKVMTFWLEKGIIGFRCDVINIIYKTSLENGKPRLVLKGLEHYHQQPGMHDILKRLRKEVLKPYQAFTVGETVMVNTTQANDLIEPDRKELDMVFSFEHMETDQWNNKWFKTKFRPTKFLKTIAKWQEQVYWNAYYFENHDQPRSVSRFANDKRYRVEVAKMLAILLVSLKGTPFIYQGQEIGMTNAYFKNLSDYKDVETHRINKLAKKLCFPKWLRMKMIMKTSRDNARQPMQWTKEGGFSKGEPWIKKNSNTSWIHVEKEEKDDDSILNLYKKMIELRKTYETFTEGTFKLLYLKGGLMLFKREGKNHNLTICVNFSAKKKRYPMTLQGELLISTAKTVDLKTKVLNPYEAFIIKEVHSNES